MNRLLFVWISTNDEVEDILFGFVMKCRSLSFGKGDGGLGRITMEVHRVAPEYLNWIEFQRRGLPLNDH